MFAAVASLLTLAVGQGTNGLPSIIQARYPDLLKYSLKLRFDEKGNDANILKGPSSLCLDFCAGNIHETLTYPRIWLN